MTKAELVKSIYEEVNREEKVIMYKTLNKVLDCFADRALQSVKRRKRFYYPDFGTFILRRRKARKGRNPQTGETIRLPAVNNVQFRPSKFWKMVLNNR